MMNEMSDEASAILLLICSHEVSVKVTYDLFTACAYACAYVDPVFISQSYDISISTTTRRTNLRPFFLWLCLCLCRPSFRLLINVLVLMLMSTQFSLAYTCACAYAYVDPVFTCFYICSCLWFAYALVKTGLKKGLIRQANKTSVLWRITKRSGLTDAGCLPFSLANLTASGFRPCKQFRL